MVPIVQINLAFFFLSYLSEEQLNYEKDRKIVFQNSLWKGPWFSDLTIHTHTFLLKKYLKVKEK